MIVHRKKFFTGTGMLAGFLVVLVSLFLPLFEGQSVLNRLDALFNSISKGSAYYVPELKLQTRPLEGRAFSVNLRIKGAELAGQAVELLRTSGARVESDGSSLRVTGDLGRVLTQCLEDADRLYANDNAALRARYAIEGQRVLFCWWSVLGSLERELNAQELFADARVVSTTTMKAVECAYNYYGIEPQKILDRIWVVVLSLVFYVVYTIWYGFAILFLFEGWGLNLSH